MSNVTKQQNKYQNQSSNNITRVGQSQNINARGPNQIDNQRPEFRNTYSQVIRSGLTQPHEISKAQSGGNPLIAQQPNLGPSVASLNQSVPQTQMSGPTVPASVNPQTQAIPAAQVMQMTSTGAPRYLQQHQAFHGQHQRPPQGSRQPLLHHRPPNAVSTNSNVVQSVPQSVPQNAAASNMQQNHHPHYFVTVPQFTSQPPPVMMNPAPHLQHATAVYQHTPRNFHQTMPGGYIYTPQAYQHLSQPYYNNPYTYAGQPQMVAHQMQSRVPTVNPVNVPPPISVQVGSTVGGANNEISDVSPLQQHSQQKPVLQKRERTPAIISNPNTGQVISEQELKSPSMSNNNQSDISTTNELHSGASSLRNSPSTSIAKPNESDISMALDFATQVCIRATEPNEPSQGTSTEVTSSKSVPSLDRQSGEMSEKSNSESDNSQSHKFDNENVLSNNKLDNSNISDDISVCEATDNRDNSQLQATYSSAQSEDDSNSHGNDDCGKVHVHVKDAHELQQNGDTLESESSFTNLSENDEAKDHTKVNANQRRKELLKKAETRTVPDDYADIKVPPQDSISNISTITDAEINRSELSSNHSTPKSSVMLSHETDTKEQSLNVIENECDIISNEEVEKRNAENIRLQSNNINDDGDLNLKDTTVDNETKPTIKLIPDLPYGPEQWSPKNPDGKKEYDRNFLIALQKSAVSLKKPEQLSNTLAYDIVLNKPHTHEISHNSGTMCDDLFMPNFANKQRDGGNYRMMTPGGINRRPSQQGRGGHQDKQRKVISTSLTQDVKLHTTDNAWRPKKIGSEEMTYDEKETAELLKTVRGILNKLTPQKYEALIKQILDLKMDTEEKLTHVLDLVFEKAVDEPAFCLQYANLCKELTPLKVQVHRGDLPSVEVKFQKLLLSKCQKEFETDVYAAVEKLDERQREIEECQEADKRKYLREVLDEDMRRARKRSLGNIKLIGELFKLNLLKGNIMLQCIDKLCGDTDNESLECLCALLKTIGKQIEPPDSKVPVLDRYFDYFQQIASQKIHPNISARVRFMLQDVIELRNSNWEPRRDENVPKTIDEIHQEAKKEDEQRAHELEKHTIMKRYEEREKRKGGRQQNDGNEWHTVTPRKSQTLQQQSHLNSIDWNAMKLNVAQGQDVQLGPSSMTSSWSQGSRGGAQTSQSKVVNQDSRQTNRFYALDQTNDNRKSQNKPNDFPGRDSSKGRSGQSSNAKRPQRAEEREQAINLTRNIVSSVRPPQAATPPFSANVVVVPKNNNSRNSSRENSAPSSRNSSIRRQTPDSEYKGSPLKGKDMTQNEMENRAKSIIQEYLSQNNISDAIEDVVESYNENTIHNFITSAINYALDVSSHSNHTCIGKLLCKLVVEDCVKLDLFINSLRSILEQAEDIEIDVPKIWDYLSGLLSPIFIDLRDHKERRYFIINLAKSCNGPLLIAKMVKEIAKLTSPANLNELWSCAQLSWNIILGPDVNIEEFIKKHELEFTSSTNEQHNAPNYEIDQRLQCVNEITKMVRDKKSNDEIQAYIGKYFNVDETSQPRFTSALLKAVVKGCLTEMSESPLFSLDEDNLKNKAQLLQKFIGGDSEAEHQALLVLQQLMEELQHPGGLLAKLFRNLYDLEVISQDAFSHWEENDDPHIPGKAICVKGAAQFLTWVRENEDEEDEDGPEMSS